MAFRTIGCKLNQCETAQMQETLLAEGYRLVDWDDPADIRVVNTCTVTAKSDRTCRHEIRLAKRLDPDCMVVVTGCYAQVDPEAVAAIPGVDLVLGNLDKLRLAEHLAADGAGPERRAARPRRRAGAGDRPRAVRLALSRASRVRGRVLQPLLRLHPGLPQDPDRLRLPLRLLHHPPGPRTGAQHAQGRRAASRWTCWPTAASGRWCSPASTWAAGGATPARDRVADLLEALLADARERLRLAGGETRIGRYRLSSIEPLEVDAALMDVIEPAGDRVAHHFHLPLQSGSDAVLRRMNRPYTAAEYLRVAGELARRFPDAAIGADVIVGFPGETEAEFEETFAFIEHAPLTYLHVFSYSDRPGTDASAMRPRCPRR